MRKHVRKLRDETGSVAASFLIVFPPVLLGMLIAMISVALYFYGGNAAVTIAQTGAAAASAEHGSAAACQRAASAIASKVTMALRDTTIACTRGATTVTVTVTGHSASLVEWWQPTVTHTATVAVERVTGP